jgi:hypothetical protein
VESTILRERQDRPGLGLSCENLMNYVVLSLERNILFAMTLAEASA